MTENKKDLIDLDTSRCNDNSCPTHGYCARSLQLAIDYKKGEKLVSVTNFKGSQTKGLCKHFLNVDVIREEKIKNKIVITDKILKLNEKANNIGPFKNQIIEDVATLDKERSLIVGYRASCGKTDNSMKYFRIWEQVLKEIKKQGISLSSENLIVGNSWATLSEGFWKEVRYFF